MYKLCIVALAVCLMTGLVGVTFAQDPGCPDCQGWGDPWNAIPQPSGLRFTAAGGGNGMPCYGDYNYCWAEDGKAVCAHWTQFSWYAQWPHPAGCDGISRPYKHIWLH
jgi:hypothetical protein